MSSLPAVPLESKFTVSALADTAEALITNAAAEPWRTSSSSDWMVTSGMVVRGAMSGWKLVSTPSMDLFGVERDV